MLIQKKGIQSVSFVLFSLPGDYLKGIDAHIQLKSYQDSQGVYVNQCHNHHNGTYRPIQNIVFAEIGDEIREAKGGDNTQKCGGDGSGRI